MKTLWKIFLISIAAFACSIVGYTFTQRPKFWCNSESSGLALLNGHYRSWSMSYSDGKTHIDGKWQPISFTLSNGVPVAVRKGYHWPTFHHVDMKNMQKLWIQTTP